MPEQPAETAYRTARTAHWNQVAIRADRWAGLGGAYHRRLGQVFRFLVARGTRVLEVGCGTGDLLAALDPAVGVGVDLSQEMIARARTRHPHLTFHAMDAHDLSALEGPFDVIILSDLVDDLWDVQRVFANLRRLCTPRTRVLINCYSRVWEPILLAAQKLGLSRPRLLQNWLTRDDVVGLLKLTDFEPVRTWEEVLLPLDIPLLGALCNRVLVKLWPFKWLALSSFIMARPRPEDAARDVRPLVSVIVPARNEAGNIAAVFARTPEMGGGTELVFVEGHSQDDTFGTIERAIASSSRRCQLFRQTGKGKGDAVRLGYAKASGDVLMILDADLTVQPEDLPRFYEALVSGKGDFINGVRLVYPMEQEAMRAANLVGNKFFSLAFSWLLGQRIKDTLCGTKVLWRRDYEQIAANRQYFGDFDPFGDFDLLFGAAKQGMQIVDLPIRYRERTYGSTQIDRWRHGVLLLRMSLFACRRIKFV